MFKATQIGALKTINSWFTFQTYQFLIGIFWLKIGNSKPIFYLNFFN